MNKSLDRCKNRKILKEIKKLLEEKDEATGLDVIDSCLARGHVKLYLALLNLWAKLK